MTLKTTTIQTHFTLKRSTDENLWYLGNPPLPISDLLSFQCKEKSIKLFDHWWSGTKCVTFFVETKRRWIPFLDNNTHSKNDSNNQLPIYYLSLSKKQHPFCVNLKSKLELWFHRKISVNLSKNRRWSREKKLKEKGWQKFNNFHKSNPFVRIENRKYSCNRTHFILFWGRGASLRTQKAPIFRCSTPDLSKSSKKKGNDKILTGKRAKFYLLTRLSRGDTQFLTNQVTIVFRVRVHVSTFLLTFFLSLFRPLCNMFGKWASYLLCLNFFFFG